MLVRAIGNFFIILVLSVCRHFIIFFITLVKIKTKNITLVLQNDNVLLWDSRPIPA